MGWSRSTRPDPTRPYRELSPRDRGRFVVAAGDRDRGRDRGGCRKLCGKMFLSDVFFAPAQLCV